MPTKLTKPVVRETGKSYRGRPVILSLYPLGGQDETLIGLRLKGTKLEYQVTLSDVYRSAALWHGQAEHSARRAARKAGVPWKQARRSFLNRFGKDTQ